MQLNDYQNQAEKTAIYPTGTFLGIAYVALGLAGEAGEVANKVKKVIRDSNNEITSEIEQAILQEAGDCLWYIAMLAKEFNYTLDDLANLNLAKLNKRKQEGLLQGSGDNRSLDKTYLSRKLVREFDWVNEPTEQELKLAVGNGAITSIESEPE